MEKKVKVDVIARDRSDKTYKGRFSDVILFSQFTEYFHDMCRSFFCKDNSYKLPMYWAQSDEYFCHYRYERLQSNNCDAIIIASSDITTLYLIFRVNYV